MKTLPTDAYWLYTPNNQLTGLSLGCQGVMPVVFKKILMHVIARLETDDDPDFEDGTDLQRSTRLGSS